MTAAYERIDSSTRFDGMIRQSHEMRYRLAAGFVEPGDVVLDAGCGTGYGKAILTQHGNHYIGIDRNPEPGFHRADFETGAGLEDWDFDVFVGLEIIEHLNDAGVQRFVALAKRARKWIIVSTPIVRNKNPFHKQQFTERAVPQFFAGRSLYGVLHQSGLYGLFVFR